MGLKETTIDAMDKRTSEIIDELLVMDAQSGDVTAMEKLDIRKRVVLSLYYFEQLSVPEIGVALNIPTGTVKSRLHSARKELKELWQQHFE